MKRPFALMVPIAGPAAAIYKAVNILDPDKALTPDRSAILTFGILAILFVAEAGGVVPAAFTH